MDLKTLLDLQAELQVEAYGIDPSQLEGDELADYVRVSTLALENELHEALNEVRWKPWAEGHYLNREAWIAELVDALHFLLNLFLVAAPTPGERGRLKLALEVSEKYQAKRERNLERQREGYDGVSGKCPACKRALDDIGTREVAGHPYCGGCGILLKRDTVA